MKVYRELEDEPTAYDLLGFKRFADSIAEIISNGFDKNTQITVGVYGDWGSGKTSFLKMVGENLEEEGIHPIWFDAWKYDKEDNLWAALIQKILDEAKVNGRWYRRAWVKLRIWKDSIRFRDGLWEVLKKISPVVFKLLLIFLSLLIILGLGSKEIDTLLYRWLPASAQPLIARVIAGIIAVVALSPGLLSFINLFRGRLGIDFSKFRHKPSYREHIAFIDEFSIEFKKIIRLIGQGKPLVVIIDDLDRCLPEKSIQVLEAIKNFLDVNGCVFLLGLDRKMVENAIAVKYREIYNIDGNKKYNHRLLHEDYMDKIIQLSIILPRLPRLKIEDFIKNLSSDEDLEKCGPIFGIGLSPNPRKIKRILRTFLFVRDMVIDDIDMGIVKSSILAKLILIQSQLPDIFEAVTERPSLVQELEKYYLSQADDQLQPNAPDKKVENENLILQELAEKYATEHPELRQLLLKKIGEGDTFINADISRYIALVGALAELKPGFRPLPSRNIVVGPIVPPLRRRVGSTVPVPPRRQVSSSDEEDDDYYVRRPSRSVRRYNLPVSQPAAPLDKKDYYIEEDEDYFGE